MNRRDWRHINRLASFKESKNDKRGQAMSRSDLSAQGLHFQQKTYGTVRRFAMELPKAEKKETRSLRRKRNLCNWRKEYLELLIFGGTKEN